jgi:hypothetical protein
LFNADFQSSNELRKCQMELTSQITTSPGPEASTSVHHAFINEAIPGWLAKARPQRLGELRGAPTHLPDWAKDASAADHRVLKRVMAEGWSAQNRVDRMFAGLKDPYEFAEPLLLQALNAQYGVVESVRETFLRLYSPASIPPWVHDFTGGGEQSYDFVAGCGAAQLLEFTGVSVRVRLYNPAR